jgi:tetratricopeptide (TPR) repeat protein
MRTRAGKHERALATLGHLLFLAGAVVALTLTLTFIGVSAVSAQAPPSSGIARAVSVQGPVDARRAGQTTWQAVKLNDMYAAGDTIRVGDRGRADLAMLDQSVLRLNANTEMTIEPVKGENTGAVSLLRGAAHFFSRGPRSLEVQTPFTVAGVRGTEFYVGVEPNQTLVTVFEGTVLAQNPAGSLTLTSGQSAVAESGKAPVLRVVARPRDAVQWTLYYPPVLYLRPSDLPATADWEPVRRSLEAYTKGDVRGAFDALAAAPPTIADPRFFAYRAHLLLSVGRADQAAADIERALRLAPNDPNALALRSIIQVVQGDRDRALADAQQAVQVAPKSATAHIALSYAQQARFDLEGARKSVETAVGVEPNNALAWARLSELWASFGELNRSLRAARQAATLDPNLSRTQTVLGYAYLMRVQTKDAKEAFEKAIALDQGDPLPRLGLGLANIREGSLHEGAREVEVAASLDPGNALIRSYLGKTYYEEKRTGLDQREYETAKQLDPNDPTPYFYDAIAKQTTNRPVEALRDMQRAIELNDNRAVYRSRLLLDSDDAARSASLGRIYTDLGFQQLALVEAWKSVNTDPTNFSSHRLLADTYASLPRHEIARVSDLLQSQLLQPINNTPIQPRLAESNLALISSSGPGTLSFNEFNPLFNRDGVTFQATGLGGENGTWAGEGVVAGIYKKLAFSAGYTHFSTNGWRPNADQRDDIGNVFAQLDLTPETSVQAEYRHRSTEVGDLQLNFFRDDFRPDFHRQVETNSWRAGIREAFTPDSILLLSYIYQRRDSTDKDIPPVFFLNSLTQTIPRQLSNSVELQHLFRSTWVNTVAGAGYFNVAARSNTNTVFNPIFGIPPVDTQEDLDVRHTNLYLYTYLKLHTTLTLTLGASGDFFETDSSSSESRNQANPKFGVVWNPLPNTTIRAAAFRVLKRTLITDQTLEPTQVAGFNQFYDDFNSTEAWRYGVALDQKFGDSVFAGIELTRRDLSIPIQTITPAGTTEVTRGDSREYLNRVYVFWTPHPFWALSAEYQYEKFRNDDIVAAFFKDVTTHRIPLGVRFFHPTGVSVALRGTFYDQDGDFIRRGGTDFEANHSQFFLLDAAVSYRLPQRYGFITVGATNLTDEHFRYQETDFRNPTIQPTRLVFTRVTLSF